MNKLGKATLKNTLNFNKIQKKFLNKSMRPTMYNLRLYYSNMRRNEHGYGRWESIYGPEGYEKTKTDRNPNNYKYKNNLFHHTVNELRHIYGESLYQIFQRKDRLKDPFGMYVLPATLSAFYLLSGQHLFFSVYF